MNRMKIAAIAFLISSLVAGGCKKNILPPQPTASDFSARLEHRDSIFVAAGGTSSIIVNGGTNGWWLTVPSNNWLVINKLYGSADFRIPVTIRANTTGLPREIKITVSPTFGQQPVTIIINQAG